jgi:hypothetical protein
MRALRQGGHRAHIAHDERDDEVPDDPQRENGIELACHDAIALVHERKQCPDDERDDAAAPEHRGPARARPEIGEKTQHALARGTVDQTS